MSKFRKRHLSRTLALQGLYELQISANATDIIMENSKNSPLYSDADASYYEELFTGIVAEIAELDTMIERFKNPPNYRIDPIMRAILQIGLYELAHRPELDLPIIIKEAITLSKEFLPDKSHTFAHAFLDHAAAEIRGKP